jgi:hypothetical protein
MQDVVIHYGTLEGGHWTRTSLGQSPQLNWRLSRIATMAPKSHKAIYGSKDPRVTSSQTFTYSNLWGELKPMHQMQWQ